MEYKLKKVAKIRDEIVLECGILEGAIVREWRTKHFVYVESNYMIYKKKINEESPNKSEEIAKINDAKNRSQMELLNSVPII